MSLEGTLSLLDPPLASLPDSGWMDVLPMQVGGVLRDYQHDILARVAKAMRSHRRVLVQAPTGAGKTHLIAGVVSAATEHKLRVLVLATRTRLVRQLHERLSMFDIGHGVIAASLPGMASWSYGVQVASVDTLYRRCIVDGRMPLPLADVVIFDEAHLALGASRQAILKNYPNAWHFGFTATPAKTSGAGLSAQFDTLVLGPTVRKLIDENMLVRPRVFNRPVITSEQLDAVSISSSTKDFVTGQLSELMSRPKIIGDVVENWLRIASGKKTLVFACDKAHGSMLTTQFRNAGVACELLTDADEDETREAAIARLESGATKVLVNCFLLSYGIDIPEVECVVLARPTRSVVLYLQCVGRSMRPAEGKAFSILIDHGRVVDSLGMPHIDRYWSLHGGAKKPKAEKETKERITLDEQPRKCIECSCMWLTTEGGSDCPNCGWKFVPVQKPVQVVQADLTEADDDDPKRPTRRQVKEFFTEALGWYAARWPDRYAAKQSGARWWAWQQTIAKFDLRQNEPLPYRLNFESAVQPSEATSGWLKHRMIRWAKSRYHEGRDKAQYNRRQRALP
jgi:DNA repair protein RadD